MLALSRTFCLQPLEEKKKNILEVRIWSACSWSSSCTEYLGQHQREAVHCPGQSGFSQFSAHGRLKTVCFFLSLCLLQWECTPFVPKKSKAGPIASRKLPFLPLNPCCSAGHTVSHRTPLHSLEVPLSKVLLTHLSSSHP